MKTSHQAPPSIAVRDASSEGDVKGNSLGPSSCGKVTLESAQRFGHRIGQTNAVASQDSLSIEREALIQRKVLPVRGANPPKWLSTRTGKKYDTEADAQTADQDAARQLAAEAAANAANPPARGSATQPPIPLDQAHNPLARALAANPAHFGPLMTPSGHVPVSEVEQHLPTGMQAPRGGASGYSHSGTNTYAGLFSQVDVAGVPVHMAAHSLDGESVPLDQLNDRYPPETSLAEFRRRFIPSQGQPADGVNLPASRNTAHAEIHPLRSQGMQSAIHRSAEVTDFLINNVADGIPPINGEGPTDEQLEQLCMAVGLDIKGGPVIGINRMSCGSNGGSGYRGGCTRELADHAKQIFDAQEAYLDEQVDGDDDDTLGEAERVVGGKAARQQQTLGMFAPTASVAGPYRHGGNPQHLTDAGWRVAAHNRFDFRAGGGMLPINPAQHQLVAASQPPVDVPVDIDTADDQANEETPLFDADDGLNPRRKRRRQ